ncbi:MAG TPA: hypothetical protein VJ957_11015, partial [Longimicrobiales bacterium]|nr:hypothetical protein [Longimicrobiales bacterium]
VARAQPLDTGSPAVRSRPVSLATGFTLAITNPPIMFWWLVGVKVAQDLGLAGTFTPRVSALFLAAGGLGLGSYLTTLAFILRRIKHMISPRAQHRMHVVLGVLLVALAAFLLVAGLRDLRA